MSGLLSACINSSQELVERDQTVVDPPGAPCFGRSPILSQSPKPPMHLDRLWRTVAAESKADGSAKLQ